MAIDGVLIIDKPEGLSSAKVVAIVKRELQAQKVGHAGTLDPFASGVLVCCVNRATRLNRFFLHDRKSYAAELFLGVETDTQDATGTVQAIHPVPDDIEARLASCLPEFVGKGEQVPPAFSALKHQGVPLYRLARKGIHIRKPARQIEITRIQILDIRPPTVRIEVDCTAGTYIRTLASDIGRRLSCGAHLSALRRLTCSGFSISQAVGLEEFRNLAQAGAIESVWISMNDALGEMRAVVADKALTDKLRYGNILHPFELPLFVQTEQFVKLVDNNQNLLAVIRFNPMTERIEYHGNMT
jgi:tRNA pseudouridine55 synthase